MFLTVILLLFRTKSRTRGKVLTVPCTEPTHPRFDKYIFLPVVNGYKTITPDPLEQGIHNFFLNLEDITTFFNSILQLNATKTVQTTGRFVVNTTVGLLGFIDVASRLDIPKHDEDFGQTLGHWGGSATGRSWCCRSSVPPMSVTASAWVWTGWLYSGH